MKMEQRVAAGLIGAVLGWVASYVNNGAVYWTGLGGGHFQDAATWMIGGAVIGVAATFLRRRT
jgi:hypothetical protein